jgi:DNA-binding PadR family transcriptional regulator
LIPRIAHGYAIITALRERSDGAFDLPEGTVYPALHRLEAAGLVGSRWSEEAGRRRRVYQLTGTGAAALDERLSEWTSFAAGVRAVIGSMA